MSTVPSGEAGGRDDDVDGEFAPQPPGGTHDTSLQPEAFHGPVGELVRLIEPESEADPAALLVSALVGLGNLIGPGPWIRRERDRHPARLFAVLVGETAKSRKGTSWGWLRSVLEEVDGYTWARDRIVGGLSSGEGLVYNVRDVAEGEEPIDPRLMVVESEFASVLRVMERPGNTLSPTLRNLWDHGNARSLVKNNPTKTTGAHIGIVGHITADELLRFLTGTEMANGFGNRFLWIRVRRSKLLPHGGNVEPEALAPTIDRLRTAVRQARLIGEVRFSPEAGQAWCDVYTELSDSRTGGLIGVMTNRAEAQVVRIALTYTLLDGSDTIELEHLSAGLAVWDAAENSILSLFANRTGDPLADRIGEILRDAPGRSMTRSELRQATSRNYDSWRMDLAIDLLKRLRLVTETEQATTRRPATVITWVGP